MEWGGGIPAISVETRACFSKVLRGPSLISSISGPEAAPCSVAPTATWEATTPAACFCGVPGRSDGGGGGRWWVFLERGDNCSVINTCCGIQAHMPPPKNKTQTLQRWPKPEPDGHECWISQQRRQVAVATTLTVSMSKLVQCTRNVYLLLYPLAGAFLRCLSQNRCVPGMSSGPESFHSHLMWA